MLTHETARRGARTPFNLNGDSALAETAFTSRALQKFTAVVPQLQELLRGVERAPFIAPVGNAADRLGDDDAELECVTWWSRLAPVHVYAVALNRAIRGGFSSSVVDSGGARSSNGRSRWWPSASCVSVPPLRAVAPELNADAMLTLYAETIGDGGGAAAAAVFSTATQLPAPFMPRYTYVHERDEHNRVTSTTATLHKLELASTHFVQVINFYDRLLSF